MPLPKEWDSKSTVLVGPFRVNNGILCHNCQRGWLKEAINVCTGLCIECVNENPVSVPEVLSNPSRCQGLTCRKCSQPIKRNNFGICRDVCYSCKKDSYPLRQRCISCNTYFNDCWNHICRKCRFRKFLCEKVGQWYADSGHHQSACFCLTHDEQLERQHTPHTESELEPPHIIMTQ